MRLCKLFQQIHISGAGLKKIFVLIFFLFTFCQFISAQSKENSEGSLSDQSDEKLADQNWDEPLNENLADMNWDEPADENLSDQNWDEPADENLSDQNWDEPAGENLSDQNWDEPAAASQPADFFDDPIKSSTRANQSKIVTSEQIASVHLIGASFFFLYVAGMFLTIFLSGKSAIPRKIAPELIILLHFIWPIELILMFLFYPLPKTARRAKA